MEVRYSRLGPLSSDVPSRTLARIVASAPLTCDRASVGQREESLRVHDRGQDGDNLHDAAGASATR
eukprot:1189593-Prorocentrum_minimum.AAC.4